MPILASAALCVRGDLHAITCRIELGAWWFVIRDDSFPQSQARHRSDCLLAVGLSLPVSACSHGIRCSSSIPDALLLIMVCRVGAVLHASACPTSFVCVSMQDLPGRPSRELCKARNVDGSGRSLGSSSACVIGVGRPLARAPMRAACARNWRGHHQPHPLALLAAVLLVFHHPQPRHQA